MRNYEFKVPRKLIKKFYSHPEKYGDYVVDLKNGMYTDLYRYENGEFITITNDAKIIAYLTEGTKIKDVIKMGNIKAAYSGAIIVSKILNFPLPELYIIEETKLPNKEITAIYSFKENEIIFNEDWINRSEWIEVLITAFHEMRHAYQSYCVRTKTRETAETLKIWEDEIKGYIMPSGNNNEIDDQSYLTQEIEVDAIAFAHWLVKKELDLKTVIPKVIRNKVADKIIQFNKLK